MLKTDFFWTDAGQAEERLRGTHVLFGDSCVYIERISSNRSSEPCADILVYPEVRSERVPLSDKRFSRFRTCLPIGWVNNLSYKRAFFVSRSSARSRQHGLSRSNTSLLTPNREGRLTRSDEQSFEALARDPQYKAAINNSYPALELVLDKLRAGTCVAISRNLCVYRDNEGIRWLFVGTDRVGIFTGADTLLLISSFSYVKEQLVEAPEFTVNNLVEF